MNPDVDRRLAGLMQRALGGDETAYAVFLREVAAVVRRTARGRLASGIGIDPEDIVQETLLAIHLKRHTWQPDGLIGPWVHAITRYKIIDALRRRGRHVTVEMDTVVETLEAEAQEEQPNGRDIARALGSLSDGQRRVVEAISVEGRSIRETAEALGMKETAVRVALHRGLAAIASRFGKRT